MSPLEIVSRRQSDGLCVPRVNDVLLGPEVAKRKHLETGVNRPLPLLDECFPLRRIVSFDEGGAVPSGLLVLRGFLQGLLVDNVC